MTTTEGKALRRRAFTLLRVLLLVAAISLGVYAVVRDAAGFAAALGQIGLPRVALAFVLVLVGLRMTAEVWRRLLDVLVGGLGGRVQRRIFFVSQLGKYLPGGVWTLAAQVDRAGAYGVSKSQMGIAGLAFIGFHLVTGVFVAAISLVVVGTDLAEGAPAVAPWAVVLLALVLVATLVPSLVQRVLDTGLRVLRRPAVSYELSGSDVAVICSWLLGTWLAYGAAVWLVLVPLLDDASALPERFVLATGAWAAAWVIGVVVIPAPAGVGPRELVLFWALAPVTGATEAVSIAIVLRVLHTFGDLVLAAAHSWSWRDRPSRPEPGDG